jgi:hypothetical protein
MKKLILIIIGILFLTSPVFAASTNLTTASGNLTATGIQQIYGIVVNTTILNSTVFQTANLNGIVDANSTSAQEVYVRTAINLTINATGASDPGDGNFNSTISAINLTLGDLWVTNSVSEIKLLNSSFGWIMNTNTTYTDSNGYLIASFNAPNITSGASTIGVGSSTSGGDIGQPRGGVTQPEYWLSNASNMTFYVEYRLRQLDVNRTVTATGGATQIYLDNVSYGGYSDMKPPVIIAYTPSAWPLTSGIINEVDYAYNYTTNYSTNISASSASYLYYPSGQAAGVAINPNQYQVLSILYTAPGAPKSTSTTTGTLATTGTTATQISVVWVWATVGVVIAGAAIVGLAWFFKYHHHY